MDGKILSAIINSKGSLNKPGPVNQNQPEDVVDYPVLSVDMIERISDSYTRILLYKISKEAHQRYSVRLNAIESLRDFSRIKGNFGNLPIFGDSEKSYCLLLYILKKYMTEEVLKSCNNIDSLILAAELLQNCLTKSKLMINCFERVIERIIKLDQTNKSKRYLQELISKSDELKIDTSLVEKIYESQKSWLIYQPMTEYFNKFCSSKDKNQFGSDMVTLFEKIIDNPSLFELVILQLKDIFVETEYSQAAQDFIQEILKIIQAHCTKYHKDTLDLYPAHIQHCVILLRIKPTYHSEKTKNQTISSLKEIFLKSQSNALILVSHFPDWLPEYQKFFDILDKLTQSKKSESCDEPINQD
ncbi:uncharacterized protein LOC131666959 [Phymastichus coffea]|uniref:uncharacterized protein LOC131666959 n=1 Tax=Phymastichus coffea TaxID=108790 RepID=UPI00273ACF8F|nr:uncharacterized protein LOC131666959 [Phymastichus coffea]